MSLAIGSLPAFIASNTPVKRKAEEEKQEEPPASEKRQRTVVQCTKWMKNNKFWTVRSFFDESVPDYLRDCPSVTELDEETEKPMLKKIEAALINKELPDLVYVKVSERVGGKGVFAGRNIKKGEIIGLYASKIKIHKGLAGNRYLYNYGADSELTFDAEEYGNYTRFLNCAIPFKEKNLEPVWVKVGEVQEIAFKAMKDVPKDHELLICYGDGYVKKLMPNAKPLSPDTQLKIEETRRAILELDPQDQKQDE